eukprot:jgi/Picsp_1/6149/NSC_03503-R1_protein
MYSTRTVHHVNSMPRVVGDQPRLVSRQRSAVIVRGRLTTSRREAQILGLGSALSLILANRSEATGLESIELPPIPQPDGLKDWQARNQVIVDSAEETFQNSDLLKNLKQKSDEKRDERKRELQDKYCRRQAELGVGDCAGLRLIPGATKSGVQEKPEWLKKLVGEE